MTCPSQITFIERLISSRDGIALAKAFTSISDARMRRSIVAYEHQANVLDVFCASQCTMFMQRSSAGCEPSFTIIA